MAPSRIVIIGGGFAGVECAKTLRKKVPRDKYEIVIFNRENHLADHAFPLKIIGDAIALRAYVMQQLERAEVCDDAARKRWYLSFIVVGGGYSGVEAAGEINDLVRGSRRFFQNNENTISFCCVVVDQQCLQGILTRTDLFRASELGAHRHTTVRDFMVAPISVTGKTI